MNVTAWSYSTSGQPYICIDQTLCPAEIGRVQCVEPEGHEGPHRYPMNRREAMLWGALTDGRADDSGE